MKKLAFIVATLLLSACANKDIIPKDVGGLRIISPLLSTNKSNNSGTDFSIDRKASIAALDAEYVKVAADLKTAMMFATYRQREDFKKKKTIGLFGVLAGIIATTLNTASPANLVTSTAFTGLQTAATSYIATDENLTDPYANKVISDTKSELEKLHGEYSSLRAELQNNSISDTEWQTKHGKAVALLQSLNFKCFSILPPNKS